MCMKKKKRWRKKRKKRRKKRRRTKDAPEKCRVGDWWKYGKLL